MISAALRALLTLCAHPGDRTGLLADIDEHYRAVQLKLGGRAASRWRRREYLAAVAPVLRARRIRARSERRRRTAGLGPNHSLDSPLRDTRMRPFTFTRDLRFAARGLTRDAGFATLAVLIMAAALAANAAVFALVESLLLRPLPYTDPARLVSIWSEWSRPESVRVRMSNPDFFEYRERSSSFAGLAAAGVTVDSNLESGEAILAVRSTRATPNLFSLLGVPAAAGNLFSERMVSESSASGSHAVISHELWTSGLQGRDDVIGGSVIVDGNPIEVVGVLPPGFRVLGSAEDQGFGASGVRPETDIWIPAVVDTGMRGMGGHMRTLPFLSVLGRLRDGVTIEEARADLEAIAAGLREEYAEHAERETEAAIAGLHEEVIGDVRPIVVALLTLVGIVLLVACASIAALLLSRLGSQTREMAIRSAIGGSRWDLVRPVLAESLLLGALAAAAGLAIANWAIRGIVAQAPDTVPRIQGAEMNAPVALATLVAAALTTLLVALVPAWRVARSDLARLLNGRGLEGAGRRGVPRTGDLVVIAEVAMSTALVLAALVMTKSVRELAAVQPGFDADRLASVRVSLPNNAYRAGDARIAFLNAAAEEIRRLPGVQAAGAVWPLPIAGQGPKAAYGDSPEALASHDGVPASYRAVTPGALEAFGLEAIQGRLIEEADLVDGGSVVVLSRSAAREAFGGRVPIGLTVWVDIDGIYQAEARVIGVVDDILDAGPRSHRRPALYFPYGMITAQRNTWLVARTQTSGEMPAMGEALRRVDSGVAPASFRWMADYVDAGIAPTRAATMLITGFGIFAFVLACAGLHGVVRSQVLRQRREIGVRLALGASLAGVVGRVVRMAVLPTLIGGLAGGALAFQLNGLLASMLLEVSVTDASSYVAVIALLAVVAGVASLVPARQAVRVDPASVLRSD